MGCWNVRPWRMGLDKRTFVTTFPDSGAVEDSSTSEVRWHRESPAGDRILLDVHLSLGSAPWKEGSAGYQAIPSSASVGVCELGRQLGALSFEIKSNVPNDNQIFVSRSRSSDGAPYGYHWYRHCLCDTTGTLHDISRFVFAFVTGSSFLLSATAPDRLLR
jgi:hypothetical protein